MITPIATRPSDCVYSTDSRFESHCISTQASTPCPNYKSLILMNKRTNYRIVLYVIWSRTRILLFYAHNNVQNACFKLVKWFKKLSGWSMFIMEMWLRVSFRASLILCEREHRYEENILRLFQTIQIWISKLHRIFFLVFRSDNTCLKFYIFKVMIKPSPLYWDMQEGAQKHLAIRF